jgi:hypothetical protein
MRILLIEGSYVPPLNAELFKIGLLDWHPTYQGRVVLTPTGEQALAAAKEIELADKAVLGVMNLAKLKEIQAAKSAAKRKLESLLEKAKEPH